MKRAHSRTQHIYVTPTAIVFDLVVEAGFAASNTGSAGWEDGSADEDNTNDMGDF